jgi:hypothetical protein
MKNKTNSKVTRVQPVFNWLKMSNVSNWAQVLVNMADGLKHKPKCGTVIDVVINKEKTMPASPTRLAWMLSNAERLRPKSESSCEELKKRMANRVAVTAALSQLDKATGVVPLPRGLSLESSTHADCLIKCEKVIIWIEGKRFDRISFSTKWDKSRDQIARNLDAVQRLAQEEGKDYCLLICHEYPLSRHENSLVKGYRECTIIGGMPHINEEMRRELGQRIGLVTWHDMACKWEGIRLLPQLYDLDSLDIG